ncbi:MAG: cytochrome P450 [Gammaproteobacteria bacterium]|nr:cytochrome P450 [Gammaproteobacteria bacterium]
MLFDPNSKAFAADPYKAYGALRESAPFHYYAPWDVWLISRYADIDRLITDPRLGRSMDHRLDAAALAAQREGWAEMPAFSRYVRVNLLELEGAEHRRLRRLVQQALSPLRIQALSDPVQRMTDHLLDGAGAHGTVDFIAAIAEPLPVYVIAEILGIPPADRHRLRPWSADIVAYYEPDHDGADEQRAEAAAAEFAGYLVHARRLRLAEPTDDLLSALTHARIDDTALSEDEVVATTMLLLNAGHEATVNAAGNGLLALLRHPEALARLRAEPALTASAVDELLRYDAPLHFFHRWVLDPLELGDTQLAPGAKIAFLYGSANRDPDAFEAADTLMLDRQPNRHFAFGRGHHLCLGAPLARLELTTLLRSLLARFPAPALATGEPRFRTGFTFRGLERLDVTL